MTNEREERFTATEDDVEVVRRSGSGLIVTPDVMARARARIEAGEDPEAVAFDVATEDVALREGVKVP